MSRPMLAKAVSLAVLACLPSVSSGQFWARLLNPTITVDMRHAPGLGLEVETIAFGPASGECSNELIQSLIHSLVDDEVRVVNRQEADLILREHQLTACGGTRVSAETGEAPA